MKKQNAKAVSLQMEKEDMERIEKIWKINISSSVADELAELKDYPEIIKKTKASLQVILNRRKKNNKNNDKINGEELTGPVLEIFKYLIVDLYRSQLESEEGCKGMYV